MEVSFPRKNGVFSVLHDLLLRQSRENYGKGF